VIDQIFVENREFFYTPSAFDAAVNLIVSSRLDRGIQPATEMLPLKGGGAGCCTQF